MGKRQFRSLARVCWYLFFPVVFAEVFNGSVSQNEKEMV